MSRGGRAVGLAGCWLLRCCCSSHRHVIVDCRLHVHLLRLHMSDDAIDALKRSRHWVQREGQGNERVRSPTGGGPASDADETNEDFASAAVIATTHREPPR